MTTWLFDHHKITDSCVCCVVLNETKLGLLFLFSSDEYQSLTEFDGIGDLSQILINNGEGKFVSTANIMTVSFMCQHVHNLTAARFEYKVNKHKFSSNVMFGGNSSKVEWPSEMNCAKNVYTSLCVQEFSLSHTVFQSFNVCVTSLLYKGHFSSVGTDFGGLSNFECYF